MKTALPLFQQKKKKNETTTTRSKTNIQKEETTRTIQRQQKIKIIASDNHNNHINSSDSTTTSSSSSSSRNIQQLVRQSQQEQNNNKKKSVVIATKIHGMHQIGLLQQSLCLLHHAYNHRYNYDVVVFTTTPLLHHHPQTRNTTSSAGEEDEEEQPVHPPELEELKAVISPTKLIVVVDNDGLDEEISRLSPNARKNLFRRCSDTNSTGGGNNNDASAIVEEEEQQKNTTNNNNITWDTECYDDDDDFEQQEAVDDNKKKQKKKYKLRYNWQSEFRSKRIWTHPSLTQYDTMMWIDADAYPTRPWNNHDDDDEEHDPIELFRRDGLVIYFNNYPQGRAFPTRKAQNRIRDSFRKGYLCNARKVNHRDNGGGWISTAMSDDCEGSTVWTVHGMFHITDLNFFRQPIVQRWLETMNGDCFLCRNFDDQLAVTIPPFVLAPNRSRDMYKSGVKLKIYHNGCMDGKCRNHKVKGGFVKFWKEHGEKEFPSAWNRCKVTENG